jgi:glycosyltransferase involved in cell wall biosynthesis
MVDESHATALDGGCGGAMDSDSALLSKPAKPLVSVVVCTWNRCSALDLCLNALSMQTLEPKLFEVVVVDNNSTDDTAGVVSKWAGDSAIEVRYFVESVQGISAARNRGVKEASSDTIVFIDDDSLPYPDHLEQLLQVIDETDADMVAGKIISVVPQDIDTDIPRGYLKRMNVSGLDYGQIRRPLHTLEYAVGANMAIKKSLCEKIGAFNECLGYTGDCKIPGDDTDFCHRARKSGALIVWAPECVVKHMVDPVRLTRKCCRQSSYFYGMGAVIRSAEGRLSPVRRLSFVLNAVSGVILRSIGYVLAWHSSRRFEMELAICRSVGRLVAACSRFRSV